MKALNLLVIGLALTCVVATGCKKKPTTITPLGARTVTSPPGPGPGTGMLDRPPVGENPVTGTGLGPGTVTGGGAPPLPDRISHHNWTEDPTVWQAETVYFDFDSAVIKSSEEAKLETVASAMKTSLDRDVKIEGHCDERGTEGYNLALGERRALAVREALLRLGIAPERIETISYGKDRPADPGHNETAWRMNRRGVFIQLSPPK